MSLETPKVTNCRIMNPRLGKRERAQTVEKIVLSDPNEYGLVEVVIKRKFDSSDSPSLLSYTRKGEKYYLDTQVTGGPIDKSQLDGLESYLSAIDPADAALIREAFAMEKPAPKKSGKARRLAAIVGVAAMGVLSGPDTRTGVDGNPEQNIEVNLGGRTSSMKVDGKKRVIKAENASLRVVDLRTGKETILNPGESIQTEDEE